MRVLFAAPDRDLLRCFQKLLCPPAEEVVTAFDGTQVLALLEAGRYDLAVLDCELPRVKVQQLLQRLKEADIRTIVLVNEPGRQLQGDAFLSYPFSSAELIDAIRTLTAENIKFSNEESYE